MIGSIRLQNFRSYKDAGFDFDPAVNIIIGPNGSGKTNLLEAILVVCQGKSYRTADTGLIQKTKDWARIDSFTDTSVHRTVKLQNTGGKLQKTFEIDEKPYQRLLYDNQMPVVLFEPNQLQKLTSSPEHRRALIDTMLEQTDPIFARHKRSYLRIVSQRNTLLKQKRVSQDQLFVWDLRMSEFASSIVAKRLELICELDKNITQRYRAIAQKHDTIKIEYKTDCDIKQYATSLLKKLEGSRQLDAARGFTGFGPHREDINILINGQPLQTMASRGETRTLLLALKNQETQLIEKARGQKPILLLDDVFGELDGVRRKNITKLLDFHQAFITTTDADVAAKNLGQHSKTAPLLWHLVDIN